MSPGHGPRELGEKCQLGDTRHGLFHTGQSVTRIPEQLVPEPKSAQELVRDIEDGLTRWERVHGVAA